MNELLLVPAQLATCILAADFLSGLFHWLEDAYGKVTWPVVGKTVIEPNLLHHKDPRAMTKNSWWRSIDVQTVLGGFYLATRWAMNALTWRNTLVVGVLVNANEIHKWAHRNAAENGRYDLASEDAQQLKHYYHQMLLLRVFEERTSEMYTKAKIGGYCHLNLGEEATIVGLMAALTPDD